MIDLKSLRKTLEELTENKPSEQYAVSRAYDKVRSLAEGKEVK